MALASLRAAGPEIRGLILHCHGSAVQLAFFFLQVSLRSRRGLLKRTEPARHSSEKAGNGEESCRAPRPNQILLHQFAILFSRVPLPLQQPRASRRAALLARLPCTVAISINK